MTYAHFLSFKNNEYLQMAIFDDLEDNSFSERKQLAKIQNLEHDILIHKY